MNGFLPDKSDFHDRLRRDGWQFTFSYSLLFVSVIWQSDVSPVVFMIIGIAVAALNLAQTALTAGYPYFDGILARPDMATMPRGKRLCYYVIEGLHWTALMIAFFATSLSAQDIAIWLGCGQLFALGMGFFSERNIRDAA